jgi:hypothetical protein
VGSCRGENTALVLGTSHRRWPCRGENTALVLGTSHRRWQRTWMRVQLPVAVPMKSGLKQTVHASRQRLYATMVRGLVSCARSITHFVHVVHVMQCLLYISSRCGSMSIVSPHHSVSTARPPAHTRPVAGGAGAARRVPFDIGGTLGGPTAPVQSGVFQQGG